MCICASSAYLAPAETRGGYQIQELELERVVSHFVGARN